ncbi:MAG TPA: amidohydrolase family protein [Streptosporangiaceae bacterium]|nr:amidohydrolase family protein [Streptosporangiaceae bacterium]
MSDGRLTLIDHHCHGVVTVTLDGPGLEALLTEAPGPPPPGTSMFDSPLGFAVRRWCAPLLDLEPSAPAGRYLERRAELGPAEVNRRLLRAADVEAWLVDTGYQSDQVLTPDQLAQASGMPAHEIVRLEGVAEQVARDGTSAAGFTTRFGEALSAATASAVGLKSIAAYRYCLDFNPARPGEADVRAAAGRWLRALDVSQAARLDDPVLLRHLIWTGVDTGLPVQFHVGFGDPDVRLHRADPSLMHDFLLATQACGTPIMLLHCYPFHRQAGYLANVFPHVYMDVGEALNHVGARSAAVLAEALELTPFHKMLYSSDAFGLAELHYLGAAGFRRDLARVTGAFVADGAWSAADADRVGYLIGVANARRVYRLGER